MKMTTKMIMLQNIEKMVMEQQRVDENDSYIRQDNEDHLHAVSYAQKMQRFL